MTKKLLFVSIYPKGTACDYLTAPFVLRNFAKKNSMVAENIDFKILNFPSGDAEKYIDKVNAEKPDYVCFSCYIWNIDDVIFIAKNLENKDGVCIFGGAEVSDEKISRFDTILNKKIFLIGEGESIFTEALLDLLNNKINTTNSVFEYNGSSSELGNIPVLYDEDFPKELIRFKEVSLETQRGCTFDCDYCWYNKGSSKIRYLDLKDVFSQLDFILENQPRELRFTDPVFFSDKERGKAILRYILGKNLDEYPLLFIENDINHLTSDILDLFAGFKDAPQINNYAELEPKDSPQYFTQAIDGYNLISTVGIQSFNKQSLASVNRVYTPVERFCEFMKRVRAKNILLKIDMIFGFPFETTETFKSGMNTVINEIYQTDCFLEIHNLLVIPNTKLFKRAELLGLKYDNTNSVVGTKDISAEEFYHGKLLCALVYRVINSPLRNIFIESCREQNISYMQKFENMLSEIQLPKGMQDFGFTDFYWQKQIFFDIKSFDLLKLIQESQGQK